MKATITKRFRFEAAHQLQDWPPDHKCSRLHGHSYVLEITVSGPIEHKGDYPGCIIDFAILGTFVKHYIVDRWDHQNLNEIVGMPNTTAEDLAQFIFKELTARLPTGVTLEKVRLYETDDGWAEVSNA